jgi:hypothetical protein
MLDSSLGAAVYWTIGMGSVLGASLPSAQGLVLLACKRRSSAKASSAVDDSLDENMSIGILQHSELLTVCQGHSSTTLAAGGDGC